MSDNEENTNIEEEVKKEEVKKKEWKDMSEREKMMLRGDRVFEAMGFKSIGEKQQEAKIVAPIIMQLVSNMLFAKENVEGEEKVETEEEKNKKVDNRNLLQDAIKNEAINFMKKRTILDRMRGKQPSVQTYLMKQNEKLKKEFTRKEIEATFATYTVVDFENIIIDVATKILSSSRESFCAEKGGKISNKPKNNYQELFDAYTTNLISNYSIEDLKGMTGSNNETKKKGGRRRRRSTRKIMGGKLTDEEVVEIMKGDNAEKLIKDNILSGEFITQFFKNRGVQNILKVSMKAAVSADKPTEETRNPLQGNVDLASEGSKELLANAMGKLDLETVKNIINSEIASNQLIIQMIYDAIGNVLCKNADLEDKMIEIAKTKFASKIQEDKTIPVILNREYKIV
jgi:hypothetical protein